jgi:hypothetical protein
VNEFFVPLRHNYSPKEKMKRKVLHISMLLLLPAALMAQSPAGTSAPKLTSAYVKMLGYKGQSFKATDAATWTLEDGVAVDSTYPDV